MSGGEVELTENCLRTILENNFFPHVLYPLAGLRTHHPVSEEAKQAAVPGSDHAVPENGDPLPD